MPHRSWLWGFPDTLPSPTPPALSSLHSQKELTLDLTSSKNPKLLLLDLACSLSLQSLPDLYTSSRSLLLTLTSWTPKQSDCQGGSMVNTQPALYKFALACRLPAASLLWLPGSRRQWLQKPSRVTPWPPAGRACGPIAPTCLCSSCLFYFCPCPSSSPPR